MAQKTLSKKQSAVIDELFAGELTETQILEKHNLSANLYRKWLADERFCAEFKARITAARLQSRALIARYSLAAAAKLVALTESQNPETARKACLDVITAAGAETKKQDDQMGSEQCRKIDEALPPETTEILLAALAKAKK